MAVGEGSEDDLPDAGADEEGGQGELDVAALVLGLARRIREREERVGTAVQLSPLDMLVLRDVQRHPGTGPSGIAQRLGLRSSNASAALRLLAERGLVRRDADPRDRRAVRLFLTDRAGQDIALVRADASAYLSPHLTADRARAVRDALAALEASLESDVS